jgi:hypothetical protein
MFFRPRQTATRFQRIESETDLAIDFGHGDQPLTIFAAQSDMLLTPAALTPDGDPDDASLLAMRAALRDLKVTMRKPKEHPRRADMLAILADARATIDRINARSDAA